MTESDPNLPPFKVTRDGDVIHRAAGHVIGDVWLDSDGWHAATVSWGEVPQGTFPNGRKYAARAVWDTYRKRTTRPGQATSASRGQ